MRTKHVIVVPYDTAWKSDFEKIKCEIECAIGDLIVGIEHVGSTSVEGMSAKPCIDMDVIIRDYSVFDEVVGRLAAIGYIHEGNLGIKDREAFKYSNKPHLKTHHLYVCPRHSEELHRHIAFRDFLRSHPDAVRKYSAVKEAAAHLFPDDIDKYCAYKSPCIEELYRLCGLASAKHRTCSLPLLTPDGIVSLEVNHTVFHPNEEDMRVTLCAAIHRKMRSYQSDTTENSLILLAKDLPEGWRLHSCFSCRYGHFCPVGDADNELFCVTEFEPHSPRDLWHVTEDERERKNRSRTLFDRCEQYLEQSRDYFTYSDYLSKVTDIKE